MEKNSTRTRRHFCRKIFERFGCGIRFGGSSGKERLLGARCDEVLFQLMNTQRKYDFLRRKSFAFQELYGDPRIRKNRDPRRKPKSNLAVVLKGTTVKVTAQIGKENSDKLETILRS